MRKALTQTTLPRRDSAIVVTVTAAIVGLIVLWMSQATGVGATTSSPASDSMAEDSAVPTTFVVAGE
jgi:hypothetical protein